jgi:hypothetical protein
MLRLTIAMIGLLILCLSSMAEVPNIINYQGRLTDSEGTAVDDGNYTITFRICTTPEGLTLTLWSSGPRVINAEDGFVNYALGSNVPIPDSVFNASNRYLGITVSPDPEISPRTRLVSSPYSYTALKSDTAMNIQDDIVDSSKIKDGTIVDADINSNADINPTKVAGIAMTLSDNQTVSGSKSFTGYHSTFLNTDHVAFYDSVMIVENDGIVIGTESVEPSPTDLVQVSRDYNSSETVMGIRSTISNEGDAAVYGIYGNAGISIASTKSTYGVYGVSESENQYKYGLYGKGAASYYSLGDSSHVYGVMGVGYYGENAVGVAGLSSAGHVSYGVQALASGGDSVNIGVRAEAVYGAWLNVGVYGTASDGTSSDVGVYGLNPSSTGDYGGYFYGNLHATGSNTKAGGGYKIDHPQDPENMYLIHSDVSSPEMKNVYDGVIELDASGEAVVELPSYFESLNENFRYQLTPIGSSMPDLYISQKIEDNRFVISGGKPFMEVSWQVTGIRKDTFARLRAPEVEVVKDVKDQGLYQNPELFGYGKEKAIDYKYHQINSNGEEYIE